MSLASFAFGGCRGLFAGVCVGGPQAALCRRAGVTRRLGPAACGCTLEPFLEPFCVPPFTSHPAPAPLSRFNVYVSQPEVKPGCVLRRANFNVLERRGLVDNQQVAACKRNMNTFAFVGDLEGSPEVSCVYHSEEAENQVGRCGRAGQVVQRRAGRQRRQAWERAPHQAVWRSPRLNAPAAAPAQPTNPSHAAAPAVPEGPLQGSHGRRLRAAPREGGPCRSSGGRGAGQAVMRGVEESASDGSDARASWTGCLLGFSAWLPCHVRNNVGPERW